MYDSLFIILTILILFKTFSITEINNHISFSFNARYWGSHNFIPFKTIFHYLFLADVNTSIRIENIVGNIIGFVPFGLMLPLLSKRFSQFKSILIATFCFSFTYEILQLLFELGSFDTDDLILYTLGGIIGYLPIKLFLHSFQKKWNQSQSSPRTVIYCLCFVTRSFFRSVRINRVWVDLSAFVDR
ncbi:VanZ family protein [Peribacillus simplex]|uniref:VanZ family protein n=2 Tax=Peribacillus TaxID=2675229 RepID=A0AA90SKZ6_9BACI|nr:MULTISPECIES: VanZ family protein [Peribacillus]MDP1419534.1 VanZ family protein [Peribacillus simplex]MDP1452501.1 VanZ family protein [Peribacillus frigoritolerans]